MLLYTGLGIMLSGSLYLPTYAGDEAGTTRSDWAVRKPGPDTKQVNQSIVARTLDTARRAKLVALQALAEVGQAYYPPAFLRALDTVSGLERTMGTATANDIADTFGFSTDPQNKDLLERLLHRLEPFLQRKELKRRIVIYEAGSDDPGAEAAADGAIYISSRLIRAGLSEDALTVLLAHEAVHQELFHPTSAYHQWVRQNRERKISDMPLPKSKNESVMQLIKAAQHAPYSREWERQADIMAVELVKKTGVPLSGVEELFLYQERRDRTASPKSKLTLGSTSFKAISTHDTPLERLRLLKERFPELRIAFGKSGNMARQRVSAAELLNSSAARQPIPLDAISLSAAELLKKNAARQPIPASDLAQPIPVKVIPKNPDPLPVYPEPPEDPPPSPSPGGTGDFGNLGGWTNDCASKGWKNCK